jgi:hypothetical protein
MMSLTPNGICKACVYCFTITATIEKRRLNTAYCDEEQNWITSCQECYDDLYAMYEEQWKDYYSGCYGVYL